MILLCLVACTFAVSFIIPQRNHHHICVAKHNGLPHLSRYEIPVFHQDDA